MEKVILLRNHVEKTAKTFLKYTLIRPENRRQIWWRSFFSKHIFWSKFSQICWLQDEKCHLVIFCQI